MADGSIVIDTRVDTEGLTEGLALISVGLSEMVLRAQAMAEAFTVAFSQGDMLVSSFLSGAIQMAEAEGPMLAGAIQAAAEQAVEAMRAGLEPGLAAEIGMGFISGVSDGVAGGAGTLAGAAQEAGVGGVRAAESALSAGQGQWIGASFGQGIAAGISSQAGVIAAAASAAAQAALSAAQAALQIHSPSRAAYAMGVLFDEGFAEGIASSSWLAESGAQRMARDALGALASEHAGMAAFSSARQGSFAAATSEVARTAQQVTIERIEIRTDMLSDGQDWTAAGRALGEAFAREARYRGAFVARG